MSRSKREITTTTLAAVAEAFGASERAVAEVASQLGLAEAQVRGAIDSMRRRGVRIENVGRGTFVFRPARARRGRAKAKAARA